MTDPGDAERAFAASADERTPDGPNPVGPLGALLRRGAAISALSLVVVQLIALAQVLVLARLLSPAEVGVFAAGTVVSTFLLVMTENGLSNALVQGASDLDDMAETVFWATLVTGLVTSLVALATAPLVGAVFGSDIAGSIAAATAGMLIVHSLTIVPDYLMQRRFNFRRRLIVDPTIALSQSIVAIALCAHGFGVWGLVIAGYASMASWVVATWALGGWRPGRGRFSIALAGRMARYALPMLVSGIGWRGRDMLEVTIVGRSLQESILGQYRYGRRLSYLPGVAVVQIASYVLFPAFARISGEPDRFKNAYLRALRLLWFVAAPVAALIVALGEPAVVLLLGEPWRGAGTALTAMAGYGLGEAMGAVGQESIMGSGRSRRLHGITAVGLVSSIVFLLLATPFGLVGIGLAISMSAILMGGTALALSRGVVGVSLRELLGCMTLPVLGSLVAMAAVASTEHLLVQSDRHETAAGIALLLAESAAFFAVYLLVMRIVAPAATCELLGMFSRRIGEQRTSPASLRSPGPGRHRRGAESVPRSPQERPERQGPSDRG